MGGGLVHAEEDRVVLAAEARARLGVAGAAGALDRLDQHRVVDGGDVVERRQRCGHDAQPRPGDAELGGQLHGQVHPDRRHGVLRPEVVVGERGVEDHRARPGALHVLDAIVGVCR